MTDIIPAEQARVPATLAEAEIVLSRHGFSCGPFMATRLACSVIALHAELAHEREAHGLGRVDLEAASREVGTDAA